MISALLVANALWFGAGFWQFTIGGRSASYVLVRPEDATARGREGVTGAVRFLGGLNLSLAALATMTLLARDQFGPAALRVMLLGCQFAVNLPNALSEARGGRPAWPVLKDRTMVLIFVVDGALTVANALVGLFWT